MSERDRVKRALQEQLRLYGDELVFWGEVHSSEGYRRILSEEMLRLIEEGHPVAENFLGQIYVAALTIVGIKAKRKELEE